ncbi:MAG: zinc ribbon domain-containing protein [Dehalococcoidia bacterium]
MTGGMNGIVSQEHAAGTCAWCQAPVPPESQFCPSCGEPVAETNRTVAAPSATAASTAIATAPTLFLERGGRLRVGDDLRRRLLEASRRELGPDGDGILREITERSLNVPFDEITYAELPHLLIAVHQSAPALAGSAPARDTARALDALAVDLQAEMRRRLVERLAVSLGPAAEPFIVNVCAGIDLDFGQVAVPQLPLVAAAVERAGAIFGPDLARSLAAMVDDAGALPGVAEPVSAIATEQLGVEGDALIRDLCRERLGKDLTALQIDDLEPLSRAVERDGPTRIGTTRTAAFIAAARFAVVNPANSARALLVQVVNREMGPAGEAFLKKTCARHGLPIEVIGYEHMPWLAGVLRQEAAPLLGASGAERLALAVERLQPEGAAREES